MASDVEAYQSELSRLRVTIKEYEEAAAKKDKQISQLTSHLRQYEMGEYGLSEAVNEIKECRKIIRARDRVVENLTDEVNALKLEISELKEKIGGSKLQATTLTSVMNHDMCHLEKDSKNKVDKGVFLTKTSQCKFSSIPANYMEDFYSTQLQNENLRLELSSLCKEAMELSIQNQNFSKQDTEDSILSTQKTQLRLGKAVERKETMKVSSSFPFEHNFKSIDDCCKALFLHIDNEDIEMQKIVHNFAKQISILKNNELILLRRYLILSDRESSLRKDNMKLRKAVHMNWRKNNFYSIIETVQNKESFSKQLTAEDKALLNEQSTCQSVSCRENYVKHSNIIMKLMAEIQFLRKLLEISHHQTQATEAMCFTQETEIKSLRDQFSLFQSQSDEKMLLGQLAMRILQLQFNQAACIFELNKYKSNLQTLEEWYSSHKWECEENGKRFASLYLKAQETVKHLCCVIKDICQRCNETLSYSVPDYKSL